jgi:hypothetical protein
MNLIRGGDTNPNAPGSARSDQDEKDQSDQDCADAGGDQGVVGSDVGLWIERGLMGFLGHFKGLGQARAKLCEAGHTA